MSVDLHQQHQGSIGQHLDEMLLVDSIARPTKVFLSWLLGATSFIQSCTDSSGSYKFVCVDASSWKNDRDRVLKQKVETDEPHLLADFIKLS